MEVLEDYKKRRFELPTYPWNRLGRRKPDWLGSVFGRKLRSRWWYFSWSGDDSMEWSFDAVESWSSTFPYVVGGRGWVDRGYRGFGDGWFFRRVGVGRLRWLPKDCLCGQHGGDQSSDRRIWSVANSSLEVASSPYEMENQQNRLESGPLSGLGDDCRHWDQAFVSRTSEGVEAADEHAVGAGFGWRRSCGRRIAAT